MDPNLRTYSNVFARSPTPRSGTLMKKPNPMNGLRTSRVRTRRRSCWSVGRPWANHFS
jgi:hypothetical protein